jgi:uracil-DNA glycosylase
MINIIQGPTPPYGKNVIPKPELRFKALELTPQDRVKVVIIGQDPYRNREDSTGLAFSIPNGRPIPGSLKNIFKSLELSGYKSNSGDLSQWASKGVLLLNSSLTSVEESTVSHKEYWRPFISSIISKLQNKPRVYWFMGKHAQSFQPIVINGTIYNTSHPSPIIPNNNFANIPHFKNINKLLDELGIVGIDWNLND